MEKARILLVDDHTDVIAGLQTLFEADDAGEIVGSAMNGWQAIQKARELKPDLVVMDFSMEDMDGIEAGSRIKHDNPQTEVVILSVHEEAENHDRAERAGIRKWILKSSPPEMLLEEARRIGNRGRPT